MGCKEASDEEVLAFVQTLVGTDEVPKDHLERWEAEIDAEEEAPRKDEGRLENFIRRIRGSLTLENLLGIATTIFVQVVVNALLSIFGVSPGTFGDLAGLVTATECTGEAVIESASEHMSRACVLIFVLLAVYGVLGAFGVPPGAFGNLVGLIVAVEFELHSRRSHVCANDESHETLNEWVSLSLRIRRT